MKNAGEVGKALRGGKRAVEHAAMDYGNAILRDFKAAVSNGYPPPSWPGTPPHLRTGQYRQQLSVKRKEMLTITIYNRSSFGNSLAWWLEYGTHRNGRPFMLPRPHWRTLLPVYAQVHREILVEALLRGEH